MKNVFISYRRDDSSAMAGRLYDSLSGRFGQKHLFFDIDTLKGGDDFSTRITNCLKNTGVLLVVIGDNWYDILVERSQSSPVDFVAIEIETAVTLNVAIVPVLVSKRAKLQFEKLLESTSPLAPMIATRHALEIDPGIDYRVHIDRLIRDVESLLGFQRRRLLGRLLFVILLLMMVGLGWGAASLRFLAKYGQLPEQSVAVGLNSIEDRSDPVRAVPPEVIFRRATGEIFISGISCYRTFDQHRDVIDEVVGSGKQLYVLLMDPDSPDIAEMSVRLNKPVHKEIRQVLTIINNNPILRGKVHIRLMSQLPSFTAVMVDGDLAENGIAVESSREIRVQHLVTRNVQHKGVILVFDPKATGNVSGFDLFATDIREQWKDAAGTERRVAEIIRREGN